MNIVYFDNAATTKIRSEVLNEMIPYLTSNYGNASSLYSIGRTSKHAIDNARAQVASLINCNQMKFILLVVVLKVIILHLKVLHLQIRKKVIILLHQNRTSCNIRVL